MAQFLLYPRAKRAYQPRTQHPQRDIERELRAETLKELSPEASLESEIETLLHRYVMADLLKGEEQGEKWVLTVFKVC